MLGGTPNLPLEQSYTIVQFLGSTIIMCGVHSFFQSKNDRRRNARRRSTRGCPDTSEPIAPLYKTSCNSFGGLGRSLNHLWYSLLCGTKSTITVMIWGYRDIHSEDRRLLLHRFLATTLASIAYVLLRGD